MDNKSQFKVIRQGFKIIRKEETPRPRIMMKDKHNPAWIVWFNCTSVDERNRIWENLLVSEFTITD